MANGASANGADKTTGVLVKGAQFDEDTYKSVQTMDDAVAAFAEVFGQDNIAVASDELGDGFALIEGDAGKRSLIGVPLFLMSWNFNSGEYGNQFVSARGLAQMPNGTALKFVLNDGGTGICAQLDDFSTGRDILGGLMVRRGLRESEYGLDKDNNPVPLNDPNRKGKASTFYLDTAK